MAIAFDAVGGGSATTAVNTLTFSQTCSTGPNRVLIVNIYVVHSVATDDVDSVTYNGVALSFVHKVQGAGTAANAWQYIYGLVAPSTGVHDVVIGLGSNVDLIVGLSQSYTGAEQTGFPEDDQSAVTGDNNSLNVSCTTVTDNAWMVMGGRSGSNNMVAAAGTTARGASSTYNVFDSGGPLTPVGAHSLGVTTAVNDVITLVAAVIAPAAIVTPTTQTLSGPTTGTTGSASTNFTITLDVAAVSTVTFTPAGTVGTNTFSPTNPQITAGNTTVTFTDTAAIDGTHVITVTDDAGLTDVGTVNYVTTTPVVAATGYQIAGPSTGPVSVASSNFMATLLPLGSTHAGLTVTPGDSGGGGTFTPSSVLLTTANPALPFTYTPNGTPATRVITSTNSGGFSIPASVNYVSTLAATGYTLSAPGTVTGDVGVASGLFTVTLTPTGGTTPGTVFTPHTNLSGAFTPSTFAVSSGSATFTFTPAVAGTHSITVTDNASLTDPPAVTYTATAAAPTTVRLFVRCPFLTTDILGPNSCQVLEVSGGSLVNVGSAITTGFVAIPNIANGWWLSLDLTPNNADGSFAGIAVFSNINGSDKAAIELYSPPTSTPTSLVVVKKAPFLVSDPIVTPGYQLYDEDGVATGGHVTAGIIAITGVTNGYCVRLSLTPGANDGIQHGILWDGG